MNSNGQSTLHWILAMFPTKFSFHHVSIPLLQIFTSFKLAWHCLAFEMDPFNSVSECLGPVSSFVSENGKWKKCVPRVRIELTTFRFPESCFHGLWDWRAAYCATEATAVSGLQHREYSADIDLNMFPCITVHLWVWISSIMQDRR